MECKAGLRIAKTGAGRGASRLSMPNLNPVTAASGRAATTGKMECGQAAQWSRRWQVSVSAGFWIDHRSSLTEITGNRMTMSMTRATNDICRSLTARRPSRSQRYTMATASSAQAELRNNSMLNPDSIPGKETENETNVRRLTQPRISLRRADRIRLTHSQDDSSKPRRIRRVRC